jgi:hypothetical protein
MHRLTSATCWLILGTWLVPAFVQPAEESAEETARELDCNKGGTRRQSSR